jgi:hypothetical protein
LLRGSCCLLRQYILEKPKSYILNKFIIIHRNFYVFIHIGNHCSSYLKRRDAIFAELVAALQHETSDYGELTNEVVTVCDDVLDVLSAFQNCRDDVSGFELKPSYATSISRFIYTYRTKFPNATITPKLHQIEDHYVPFFATHKIGLGLFTEGAIESLHAKINVWSVNLRHMRNAVKKQERIVLKHALYTHPRIRKLAPKRRALKTRVIKKLNF